MQSGLTSFTNPTPCGIWIPRGIIIPMDENTKIIGRLRIEAMEWALRTATPGEAADRIMARAVYYADWVGELAERPLSSLERPSDKL